MATEKRIKIIVDSRNAKRDVDDFDDSMRGLGNSSDRTTEALDRLSAVASAVIAALSIQRLTQYSDQMKEIRTQVKLVTDSTAELNRTQNQLLLLANDTNSRLEGTVGIYTKLTRATSQLGSSQKEILDVTRAINQSFVISGASADDAANAIRQLNQGLASGVLRGEEFNAINENADRLARALADSLGVTRGELRALAAEGVLTTEKVFTAILEQADAIDKEFAQVDSTVSRSLGNLEDTAINVVGILERESGIFQTVAREIDLLADVTNAFATETKLAGESNEIFKDRLNALKNSAGGELLQNLFGFNDALDDIYGNIVDNKDDLRETAQLFRDLSQATGISNPNQQPRTVPLMVEQSARQQTTRQPAANEFANLGTTPNNITGAEQNALLLRTEAQAEQARIQEELQRQNQQAISDQFLRSEKQRTQVLQNELERRLKVQAAYDAARIEGNASVYEKQAALRKAATQEELARLEEQKANLELSFEERRQSIVDNERLTEEARQEALSELREQELTQEQIFQQRKTEIENSASKDRVAISQAEEEAKRSAQQATLSAAASLLSIFANENKAAAIAVIAIQKGLAIAQAIQNTQVASLRALAELGPIAGPPVAAKIEAFGATRVALIAATGLAQAAGTSSGGGSSINASASQSRSQSNAPSPEPPRQSSSFEIKGLSRINELLSRYNPDDPLPAEVAQRFLAGFENIRDLQGGSA